MIKYAIVDKDTCIACGSCGETAPAVFGYDDEGVAEVIMYNNSGTAEITEEMEEDLLEAEEGCPTESIKVGKLPFYDKGQANKENL